MKGNVGTLLRLDFKSRFAKEKKSGVKGVIKTVIGFLFILVVYAIIIMGINYLTKMFVSGSNAKTLNYEYLVIVTMAAMVIQLLVTTGALVKNLYFNGDNELLLRFPVNGTEILLAKSIYVIIYNFIVGLLVMMPFYINYGIVSNAGVGFYFASVGVFIVASLLPYAIANIIAVPVMALVNVVKNRFLVVLILLIVMIAAGFAVYMILLTNVMEYIQEEQVSLLSPEVVEKLAEFAKFAYPFNWYANMLYGKDVAMSAGIVVGITLVTLVLAFITIKATYFRTILKGIETEKTAFTKKTSSKSRGVFRSLMRREFLMIFRSFNYCFQYFAMAVAAPVMVYFCNSLASKVGTEQVGTQILPGLTMLVVIIFITIIVSFASTAISREGNTFYFTKTIPVSFKEQVTAKLLLYVIVATASVILSCVVVYFGFGGEKNNNLVTLTDVLYIFGICELLVIALSCATIRADIKSPTFNVSGDGEIVEANKNVSLAIFFGCLLAIGYGLFAMIFSFISVPVGNFRLFANGMKDVSPILLLLSLMFAVISVAALYWNIEKNYNKIVP